MISEEIKRFHSELPAGVELVAVSKFHPGEAIMEAYEAGQRIFGESRVQEFLAKVPMLPSDIEWHFIGHLQTNKLKMVLPYVSLVQSVDSVRLLDAVNAWGAANSKVINVLLEPHVAAEETKQGFDPEEVVSVMSEAADGKYGFVAFKGIMGMATFTDDESVVRADFCRLREVFDNVRQEFPLLSDVFSEFSIGMSDDYHIAIEYGSTMIRIGSMIFGNRNY